MAQASAPAGADPFLLDLPCGIDAVEQARSRLGAFLRQFSVCPTVINRIEVVLEELVSNVARHSDQATSIRIAADADESEVRLAVSDNGAAFNPLERADPKAFEDVGSAKLGGLGIPLVKRLTKSARYARTDGRNEVAVAFARD